MIIDYISRLGILMHGEALEAINATKIDSNEWCPCMMGTGFMGGFMGILWMFLFIILIVMVVYVIINVARVPHQSLQAEELRRLREEVESLREELRDRG